MMMTPIEKALDALKPFANLLAQAARDGKTDATNIDCQIAVHDMRKASEAIAALEAQAPTDERAMFEAWFNDPNSADNTVQYRVTMADMRRAVSDISWKAWQARALLAAQPKQSDDWRQYAKPGETAQEVIERNRKDMDALLSIMARRAEQAKPEAKPVGAVPEGWQLVPKIGASVKAKHPITYLNPTEYFEVSEICVERDGAIAVRGDDTCWFGLRSIEQPAQPLQAQSGERDALDAERYRWLRDKCDGLSYTSDTGPRPSTPEARMMYAISAAGKRTTDMIEIRLLCHHLGPHDEPIWRDGEHFDYAANMDAAIDAAITKTRGAV